MYARVVRFTDVTPERIEQIKREVESNDGPPEGVNSTGMKLFFDAGQGTALFTGFFESAEDMAAADEIFDSMDSADTPGSRASVDRCEVVIELDA